MSVDIVLTPDDDNSDTYEPGCSVWIELAKDGTPSYFVDDGPHSEDGPTTVVRVSAEVWRDVARAKSIGEIRQLRRLLSEALDKGIDGTVANLLSKIAERMP